MEDFQFVKINDVNKIFLAEALCKRLAALEIENFKREDYLERIKDFSLKDIFSYIFKDIGIDNTLISELSRLPYEGQTARGMIYFASHEYKRGIKNGVKFIDPQYFDKGNLRLVRKLLETCNKDNGIIVNNEKIIGVGKIDDKYLEYTIRIDGNNSWTFEFEDFIIKNVDNVYYQATDDNMLSVFLNKIQLLFENCERKRATNIFKRISTQARGALLIFTDEAEDEITRLSKLNRGFHITKKILPTENLLMGLSSIDGAMFFDESCKCYGVGVILDGKAIVRGTNERGARYNSTYNYIANKKSESKKYLAVVVSEDKMIDVFSTNDEFELV